MEQDKHDKFAYTWTIENFSIFRDSPGRNISSPYFIFPSLPRLKWVLCLKNASDGDENFFDISIRRADGFQENCSIEFYIELLDFDEELITDVEKQKQTFEDLSSFAYTEFFKKSYFPSLKNDILIIKFHLERVTMANDELTFPSFSYKNASFADVVLSAGDAVYKVHKAILSARWPKLVEKLEEEKAHRQVMNIEPNVLEAMLEYVYTGKLNCTDHDILVEINSAAAEYELDLYTMPPTAEKVRTRIKVQQISFNWKIESFSNIPVETELYSQVFSFHTNEEEAPYRWTLIFCKCDRGFKIFIKKMQDKRSNPLYVESNVSLCEGNSQQGKHMFKNDNTWKCAEFSKKISTDRNDALLLNCKIKFSDCSCFHETTERSCAFRSTIHCYDIYSDLKILYETQKFPDVHIKVGSKLFLSHKFILSTRSTVFARIFATEVIDFKKYPLEVSDVDPDIFNEFLIFMYCGHLTHSLEGTAEKLYALAAAYSVPALKEICSAFLQVSVVFKNMWQLLRLAYFNSDDALYKRVLAFFCAHIKHTFASEEWKETEKDESVAKLLEDAILKKK